MDTSIPPTAGETTAPQKDALRALFEATPLSHVLAAVLFVTLLSVVFWIGRQYSQPTHDIDLTVSSLLIPPITVGEPYVAPADGTYNFIETIDAVLNGVMVSTSSAPFYEDPIPQDIAAEIEQGYQRFTGPGYSYAAPSDYLYKDNTVFYLPVGVTSNPAVLISRPKSFKTFTEDLALGDGTIYYNGQLFQKSKTLAMLQWDYYVSDTTIFSPRDDEPETKGLGIKTIFEGVDGAMVAPVKELQGNPYAFQLSTGDGIFQDSKFLYCIKTGKKITRPVTISFTPASEESDPYYQFNAWHNGKEQTGAITFTETATGYAYNDRCERL